MRPNKSQAPNGDLFRSSLEAILDPGHELIRLGSVPVGGRIVSQAVIHSSDYVDTWRARVLTCL